MLSLRPTPSQCGNFHQPQTGTALWADTADERTIDDESRRSFFTTLTSLPVTVAAVATAGAGILASTAPTTPSTTLPKLRTVKDALNLISLRGDRKFLHSVVASDYRFLYRGAAPAPPRSGRRTPTLVSGEAPDLLLPGTYPSPDALAFFQTLERAMVSSPVRPSNGHLATTSVRDAAEWGSPVSIWPLDGGWDQYAHFAWYEDAGKFWPRTEGRVGTAGEGIIVDGVNCGSVNLEDALRTEGGEVMFGAEEYLEVPAEWDRELREELKGAFLL